MSVYRNELASVCCATALKQERFEPAERYCAFFAVLDRETQDWLAAIELVLAQRVLSAQLIDNLNASIHFLRLLMDFFLLGEHSKFCEPEVGSMAVWPLLLDRSSLDH